MNLHRSAGVTLFEILVVVVLIGLVNMIAIPSYLRNRSTVQRNVCIGNFKRFSNAKDIFALDNNATTGVSVDIANDLVPSYRHALPAGSMISAQWENLSNVVTTEPRLRTPKKREAHRPACNCPMNRRHIG